MKYELKNPRYNEHSQAIHDLLVDGKDKFIGIGYVDALDFLLSNMNDDDIYVEHDGPHLTTGFELRAEYARQEKILSEMGRSGG